MNDFEKRFLLDLAANVILFKSKKISFELNSLTNTLKEKSGCFVTLYKNKNLRGCVGYILPCVPLYEAVIENAYNAAFEDYRFPPVECSEISSLTIEISKLTVPKVIEYSNTDDLLKKLNVNVDGVFLEKDGHSATFLPQVWKQIPEKDLFLSNLCSKAGLGNEEWKKNNLKISVYQVEILNNKSL